jgi:hypothetical protein
VTISEAATRIRTGRARMASAAAGPASGVPMLLWISDDGRLFIAPVGTAYPHPALPWNPAWIEVTS